MLSLLNPIPEAVRDVKALEDLIGKYNIVPYFGCDEYTSHSFINLLSDVSELSPSHQACKEDFKTYAFGNCMQITAKTIPGFFDESFDTAIPREQQLEFINWLSSLGISLSQLINCVNELNNAQLDSANSYLHIKIIRVGGTQQVFFAPLHYTQCGYLRPNSGEVKRLINTEYWTEDWWEKKRPLLISASHPGEPFNWDERGNTKETILHIKGSGGKSKYYGRSKLIPIMYWMFVEFQLADLAVKTSKAEYTAKKLLAFEEPKPERRAGTKGSGDSIRSKMSALRRLVTTEGDMDESKTIAGIQYPHGGKPPTAIDLELNRDTKHAQYQWDMASSLVHAVNGWDRGLTNIKTPKSNIGGNVYRDIFTIKSVSTISPMADFWSGILTNIFEELGAQTKYSGEIRSPKFKSAIDNLVDKLNGSSGGAVSSNSLNRDVA